MRTEIKTILFTAIMLSISLLSSAQKLKTDTLTVDGNCGMCKNRIEKALDVKGVAFAEWNQKTHLLTVSYRPDKITLNQISAVLNKVGHDTRISRAEDADYNKLHGCCNYRESSE